MPLTTHRGVATSSTIGDNCRISATMYCNVSIEVEGSYSHYNSKEEEEGCGKGREGKRR